MSNEKEWTEFLGNDIKLIVSKKHCISTDTVLLANFSFPKPKERLAADLGTGCGSIPLLWYSKGYLHKTIGVEIQPYGCELFNRSISLNQLESKITVLNQDLKDVKSISNLGSFDLVVCNPPYKTLNAGEYSPDSSRATARHEMECTIDDILNTSKRLLRSMGRLCMCNRIERLTDVMMKMRNMNIEPKKLQFVQQRESKPPKLFLIEGKKDSKPGIEVLPTLFIESGTMKNVYGEKEKSNNDR